jgi:hypothetical protein
VLKTCDASAVEHRAEIVGVNASGEVHAEAQLVTNARNAMPEIRTMTATINHAP